jgi:hypothetical protein
MALRRIQASGAMCFNQKRMIVRLRRTTGDRRHSGERHEKDQWRLNAFHSQTFVRNHSPLIERYQSAAVAATGF